MMENVHWFFMQECIDNYIKLSDGSDGPDVAKNDLYSIAKLKLGI